MMINFVVVAPQKSVLRDGHKYDASRFGYTNHLSDGLNVILDVLQNIECANEIKRIVRER
jgi:hypothetical protein